MFGVEVCAGGMNFVTWRIPSMNPLEFINREANHSEAARLARIAHPTQTQMGPSEDRTGQEPPSRSRQALQPHTTSDNQYKCRATHKKRSALSLSGMGKLGKEMIVGKRSPSGHEESLVGKEMIVGKRSPSGHEESSVGKERIVGENPLVRRARGEGKDRKRKGKERIVDGKKSSAGQDESPSMMGKERIVHYDTTLKDTLIRRVRQFHQPRTWLPTPGPFLPTPWKRQANESTIYLKGSISELH